ncbi:hypothetical protein H1R20_g7877, partial [Candolleomyces eurysporus]
MFGNVTSSWANPQQNQQTQQQGTGAFGQPSAFGATNTTSAFGTTGAFGQPQQQQTPQANPMFGNLSTPAANTGTTSAFGGFGGTANTSSSAFAPKPTTGFGAFGGGTGTTTSTFGSGTSAFGQPANTSTTGTGLFGQPSTTTTTGTSAFGGGGGLFGNKTSAFGTAIGTSNPPTVTTGTSNPPWAAHTEKDSTSTSHYQAISCMPAYMGYSFEELRTQDYAQGRKTAGAFGQSAAFGGAATTQPTTGLFGATQPAQTASTFGTTPAAPATTGFGAFGGNTNSTTTTTGTTGTGLFGTGGAFGTNTQQQQQPAQAGAFGTAFGQTQQQQQPQQSTGLFGGTNAFGTAAPKPAFGGFGTGTTGTTTGAFGAGTGAFGTQNTQQTQPATTGLFGTTQPANTTANAFGGGAFGTGGNKSLFGATNATTTQPTTTPFGGFGATQQPAQQTQQQQGTGLFGGTNLFGQQNQQQTGQQGTGTGLFGNTNPQQGAGAGIFGGGGLFGNAQQNQQQPQQQSNLFGPKPAAPAGTGLFGGGFGQQQNTNPTQAGTGLFGNTLGQNANQQQSTAFGGNIFGKPTAPALGTAMSTGQPTGLFGNSTNNLAGSTVVAAPALTASINQPIGSNLPIFSMLPPGPRLVDLDQSQPKKKPPFFVDVPTRSPVPRVQPSFAPATSKLRGFGASTAARESTLGNPFAGSVAFLQGKPNALTLSERGGSVGPDSLIGRSGSPALGSGSRQSVKKVILDKKVEPSQLFVKSSSPSPGGKVVFSPALSIAARESEAAAASALTGGKGGALHNAALDSPTPAPRVPQKSPNRFTAQTSSKSGEGSGGALQEGDYWVKPDLASLKKLGYDELSAFKGLVVGRVGYGQIEFLEPVDLTGLSKLGALLGEVIHFEDKECSVYPDSEDADKPPPGSGLNVKAKLTLERCWAVDKATREPIKDASHPTVVKHLKRLKNMKDTHFQDFDMELGEWTFTVDHF